MASDRDRSSDDRSSGHEGRRNIASIAEGKTRDTSGKGGHKAQGEHKGAAEHEPHRGPRSPEKNEEGTKGGERKSSGTSRRGFASMDEEKQRQIASKGGHAAHQKGTAHEFTSEEAREAGRKGGHAAHQKGTAHEFTSEEAREAGRKGGHAAHEKGTAHEFTSEEAREAGRKGGESSHGGYGKGGARGQSSSSTRADTANQHAKAGSHSHKHH